VEPINPDKECLNQLNPILNGNKDDLPLVPIYDLISRDFISLAIHWGSVLYVLAGPCLGITDVI
jgi:hypothetical protein